MKLKYTILTFLGVFVVLLVQTLQFDLTIRNLKKDQMVRIEDFTELIKSERSHNQILAASSQYALERVNVMENRLNDYQTKIQRLEFESRLLSVMDLIVTAYTPTEKECDADPDTTAAMLKPRLGMVAVSRDLFEEGWVFGKKVYIEGLGIFKIGDLMNKRWEKRIDIVMLDEKQALNFGLKQKSVALLDL